MDIWAWVHEKESQLYDDGETRLAEIMDSMPGHCCNDEHDVVDALFAEGLPLAQKAKEPWVEVFIRHWYLQSQVLTRNNAKGMLSEAIELLELSHREDAKKCPQRICAVQDLANCYGKADGPGFAAERLAVSKETLAEINPAWPCFTCIGSEYIDALIDDQSYQEAVDEGRRLRSELVQHEGQESTTVDEMLNAQARALIRMMRYEEAVSMLISKPVSSTDGSRGKKTYILLCLALAHLGRFDEMGEHMVSIEDVLKSHTYYNDWAEIQSLLINAKQLSFDDELAKTLWLMSENLIANGSYRCAFKQLLTLADLAIKSEYFFNANLAIEKIETVTPLLNKDCGAEEAKKNVNEKFLSASKNDKAELFSDEKSLFDFEFSSADKYAQSLELFVEKNPSNVKATSTLADFFSVYGHKGKGLTLLKRIYQSNESDPHIAYAYARFLLKEYGRDSLFDAFDEIMSRDSLDNLIKLEVSWLYAHAYQKDDPEKAIKYFEDYLHSKPQDKRTLFRLAWLKCDIKKYDESTVLWDSLIELEPDDKNLHWDKLIPATLNDDWDSVREASKEIGIKLEGDSGKVNQKMGRCRIRFDGELGDGEIFYAQRTGPVSASILGIANLGEKQRFGQELVFNPEPLNVLDQKDSDGDDCDSEGYYNYLYKAYRFTQETPYHCYAIDGVHPGKESVDLLIAEVEKNGFTFDQRSNERYILEYSDDSGVEQESLGFYAYVLIAPNGDKNKLNEIFDQFSQNLEHPLIWPKLLEELELIEALEEQSIIEEKYCI